MKLLRENLLFHFSVASFIVMVVLGVALSWGISQVVREQVLAEKVLTVADDLSGRIQRHLTSQDLAAPMTGNRYSAFQSWVEENIVSLHTARIKIWDRQGRVIYSNDPAQVGQVFPIKPELKRALEGGNAVEISVPAAAENERERFIGTLIEVYTPITFPQSNEVAGAFEIYEYYAPVAEFIAGIQRTAYLLVAGGLVLLYISLFFIVRRGWDTINRQQGELQVRLREIGGLNNLMRTYLDRDRDIIQGIKDLGRHLEAQPEALSGADLVSSYLNLSTTIQRLAAEAEGRL